LKLLYSFTKNKKKMVIIAEIASATATFGAQIFNSLEA
jgi:hypothetical protein